MKSQHGLRTWTVSLLAVALVCAGSGPAIAQQDRNAPGLSGALWSADLGSEIKWFRTTFSDVTVVQTETDIFGLDGSTGDTLWEVPDVETHPDDVSELSDLLLVNVPADEDRGLPARGVVAVDVRTGENRWEQPKILGRTLVVINLPERGRAVLVNTTDVERSLVGREVTKRLTMGFGGQNKIRTPPDFYMVDVDTGEILWHHLFNRKVELAQSTSTFGATQFNLAGIPPTTVIGDDLYIPWSGFTKIDLNTGRQEWQVEYDTGREDFYDTDTYVIEGDIAYTSARGDIRAISLTDGKVIWEAGDMGDAVPQLLVEPEVIYARLGGVFYRSDELKFDKKGKKGMVALDRATGKKLWKFEKTDDRTTNFVPWGEGFVFADKKAVYHIDRSGDLIFEQSIKFEDYRPFKCELQEDDRLAIRSEAQRMVVDLGERLQVYNVSLPPPDVSNWMKFGSVGLSIGGGFSTSNVPNEVFALAEFAGSLVISQILSQRPHVETFDFFLSCPANHDTHRSVVRVERQSGDTQVMAAYGDADVRTHIDAVYGKSYASLGNQLYAHDLMVTK